ncbi:MAG: helix-turn-helix domain-containing protein [Candidatus Woesearchaeota archaeon]|nr:helix-turn-helix domain-containing protein [Candidatus Woesearchaeota archaeon]
MNTETLISLGLSRREAEVYYSLLQVNDALASEISEKTHESRTNTYDTISSLIKKGLVSYVFKNNRKYFMATSPKKLLEWMDLRKEEIEKERETVEKLIPELIKLRLPKEKKVIVEVYEGKEGLRTVFKETIESSKETKKEFLIFGAIAGHLRELDPIYHERYYKEREKYKIKTRYIFIDGEKHPIAPYSRYKYLPKIYKSFVATAIHGDEVSFWLLTKPEIVILVKSKELAETYRSNFEVLWKIAKS